MRRPAARPGGARGRRLTALALTALVSTTALAGCTTALGQQASTGDQKNYIGGDGSYKYILPKNRGAAVEMSGRTATGSTVDVAKWRGDVVVINTWFAACSPCRAEAPDLAALARSSGSHVHFLGINTDDGAADVTAFDTQYSVPYPSILDHTSGAAVLALRGIIPPAATPSTIVLDAKGRPAARIVGRADPDVLKLLIQDVRENTLTPHVTYHPSSTPSASATAAATASASS